VGEAEGRFFCLLGEAKEPSLCLKHRAGSKRTNFGFLVSLEGICGNMQKIKLVAMDLDGTMLSKESTITRRVKDAVAAVRAAGVYVTISTGRMFSSAVRFARELGLEEPLITYQGALVKDYISGRVLRYLPLPLVYARDIIARVQQLGYHMNGYLGDRLLVEKANEVGRRYAARNGVDLEVVGDFNKYFHEDPTKLVVIAGEEQVTELMAELLPVYQGKVHLSKSLTGYLEFSHPLATKGEALAYLAEYLNVPQTGVMAIGDSYNDVEMLQYAGVGVAVANAREDVKLVADNVTSEGYGDGVVEVLEKCVLAQNT
jgi:Cof subfamily protein (haloacid dehalogenase superfamily)